MYFGCILLIYNIEFYSYFIYIYIYIAKLNILGWKIKINILYNIII